MGRPKPKRSEFITRYAYRLSTRERRRSAHINECIQRHIGWHWTWRDLSHDKAPALKPSAYHPGRRIHRRSK